jgi:ATP-dependent DNA ligase
VIDGEAVILGDDGFADFDALHNRKRDAEAQLVAFDLLLVGEDVRSLPLHQRKGLLAKMLAKCGDGMQLNPHMEGDVGLAMFEHACKLGLEGIASKHRDRPFVPVARRTG